jgi:putative hemolysin
VTGPVLELLSLVVLLALSGFFSGSETALFALSDVELAELDRGTRRERQAVALARRPQRTLVTILLANTIVNTIVSVLIASLALRAFGVPGLALAIPAATILVLLFGEIVPKSLGLRRRRGLAVLAAPVLASIAWLLGPVRRALEVLAGTVARGQGSPPLSREELGTLVDVAREEGGLSVFEGRVLRRVLRFRETPIERCMTPRVDMVTVGATMPLTEVLGVFERSGRSRLPVTGDGPEDVVGVLLLKDVVTDPLPLAERTVESAMRGVIFEPETLPAAELFRRFQRRRVHLAVVVGEHGGVEGIVTLEDLLEELIGDIRDESDELGGELEELGEDLYRGDASLYLEDVCDVLGLRVDVEETEALTLSGLLQEELGRVPRRGDELVWQGWRFRVLTASPNRARLLQISRALEMAS